MRVDGRRVRDGALLLSGGEEVAIEEERRAEASTSGAPRAAALRDARSASAAPFPIIHEDDALLVVDKPTGLAVHPGEASGATLIDALRSYGRARGFEPFLVHRLDRNTTGVLVVAKSKEAASRLGRVLKEGRGGGGAPGAGVGPGTGAGSGASVKKWYLALVFGEPPAEARITDPLDGDAAESTVRLIVRYRWGDLPLALLEVRLHTGRKHQIRRHLSGAGYPIAGDELYGDWEKNRRLRKELGAKGLFLHSAGIELAHPVSGERMRFEAGIPGEFKRLIGRLSAWEDAPRSEEP